MGTAIINSITEFQTVGQNRCVTKAVVFLHVSGGRRSALSPTRSIRQRRSIDRIESCLPLPASPNRGYRVFPHVRPAASSCNGIVQSNRGPSATLRTALARSRRFSVVAWRSRSSLASVASAGVERGDLRTVRECDRARKRPTAGASETRIWTPAKEFDEFARVCCGRAHLRMLADPDSFSLTQRVGRIGPVALSEIAVGSDLPMDGDQVCGSYRVIVVQAGRTEAMHRGSRVIGGPGSANVFTPEGLGRGQWDAGSRMICFKIDRSAVDDALSDALGWQVTSQVDFTPVIPTNAPRAQSWIRMLVSFKELFFRSDSLLNQPLVGLPFVESVVLGFLLAAEHPHLDALTREERVGAPRAIRTAVDIIEAEAHLPLTLSSIAARSHLSVRTLQQGFQRYMGSSPMSYLREVRLRRAHEALLKSDPSMVTVASVAYQWGFSNLGRFAAAHAARYRERPTETLHRRAFKPCA